MRVPLTLFLVVAVASALGGHASAVVPGPSPFPGFWPSGVSLTVQGYDFWTVWLTRSEVRRTPTTVHNLNQRYQVLPIWTAELTRRGLPAEDVAPRQRLAKLSRSIAAREYDAACAETDAIYRELEQLVAGKEPVRGVGVIEGAAVDETGAPLADVAVTLFGTPLGAVTTPEGRFKITGIPCLAPRYILRARKAGYLDGYAGALAPQPGRSAEAIVLLEKLAPENRYRGDVLAVKVARLVEIKQVPELPAPADPALIDMQRYPDRVRPYLKSSTNIDSDSPEIRAQAQQILASVAESDRTRSLPVVRAVYDWVARNVDADLMANFPGDPTCGQWQTTFGAWGQDYDGWCYKPSQVLTVRRGTSIEHARLAAALLRALGIPARPACLGNNWVCQWWVQLSAGGFWSNIDTALGRETYRRTGKLDPKLPVVGDERIALWGFDERAPIHMTWDAKQPCLWLEDYGQEAPFPHGLKGKAGADRMMASFAERGFLPGVGPIPAQPLPRRKAPYYLISTRGVVINLASLGPQRSLTLRFPVFVNNQVRATLDVKHWTNHPEWIKPEGVRREREEEIIKVTGDSIEWFCLDFELGVPGAGPPKGTPVAPGGGTP